MDAPFDAPRLVNELDSKSFDLPSWISPDGCVIYLYSGRGGSSDLFVAHRGM